MSWLKLFLVSLWLLAFVAACFTTAKHFRALAARGPVSPPPLGANEVGVGMVDEEGSAKDNDDADAGEGEQKQAEALGDAMVGGVAAAAAATAAAVAGGAAEGAGPSAVEKHRLSEWKEERAAARRRIGGTIDSYHDLLAEGRHLWALPGADFSWGLQMAPPFVTYTRLYDEPPILRVNGLLPRHICEALIALAAPSLSPSLTITHDTGVHVRDPVRTSYTTLLQHGQGNAVVDWTVQAAARAMGTTVDYMETLQVVRYLPGEKFLAHHDFINAERVVEQHGQRCKTLFIYLSDREEGETGGTTRFTRLDTPPTWRAAPKQGEWEGWCEAGSGLLWANLLPDGSKDYRSLHEGTPPVLGVKWGLNAWARTKRASE